MTSEPLARNDKSNVCLSCTDIGGETLETCLKIIEAYVIIDATLFLEVHLPLLHACYFKNICCACVA